MIENDSKLISNEYTFNKYTFLLHNKNKHIQRPTEKNYKKSLDMIKIKK